MATVTNLTALFARSDGHGTGAGLFRMAIMMTGGLLRASECLPDARFPAQRQHKNREGRGKLKRGDIKGGRQ
ncbi:hypothetical protein NG99_15305, partial [Erwinia typographi]